MKVSGLQDEYSLLTHTSYPEDADWTAPHEVGCGEVGFEEEEGGVGKSDDEWPASEDNTECWAVA